MPAEDLAPLHTAKLIAKLALSKLEQTSFVKNDFWALLYFPYLNYFKESFSVVGKLCIILFANH